MRKILEEQNLNEAQKTKYTKDCLDYSNMISDRMAYLIAYQYKYPSFYGEQLINWVDYQDITDLEFEYFHDDYQNRLQEKKRQEIGG